MSTGRLRSYSNFKESVSSTGSFSSLNSSTSSFHKLSSQEYTKEDFKEDKSCFICSRKFTFTLRRHHCRMCKESVCHEHCVIRYLKEGNTKKMRLCDKCDRKHIKEELQFDILTEINSLQNQILLATEQNQNLYKEKFERTSRIHNLEMKLNQTLNEIKRKDDELASQLKEEIEINNKAKIRIEEFMKNLKELQVNEQDISVKIEEENKKLAKIKIENNELEEKKNELENQAEDIRNKLKNTYQIEGLKKICCEDCKRKVTALEKPRMSVM